MKTNISGEAVENPAQNLMDDAKELMSATADVAEDKVVEARRRLAAALERCKDVWGDVQDKAVAGARVADETIREYPYQSLGVAFGIGALIGFLWNRRD